jgi:chaperonin cofactor prefoldin
MKIAFTNVILQKKNVPTELHNVENADKKELEKIENTCIVEKRQDAVYVVKKI